uniref:General transcription factor IIH subunit n=1 Tax=Rhabditophanes sp. KR3021 TaxID=114890 RepID=A0AC35TMJ8_9BILA
MNTELNDEDLEQGYAWEKAYTDAINDPNIQEDANGSIELAIKKVIEEERRKNRIKDKPERCRIGVLRYLYIVLDMSEAMSHKAMQPSRIEATIAAINTFIDNYFAQNPISQLGIVGCRDKKCEKLCPLTGNIAKLKDSIKNIKRHDCRGEFSLQNGLHLAYRNLQAYPIHTSREILVVQAALATCDADDIFTTMEVMISKNIRVSGLSLSAFLHITNTVCVQTGGQYKVILDKDHLELSVAEFVRPPVIREGSDADMIMVGFPTYQKITTKILCQCHRKCEAEGEIGYGYLCIKCGARYCSVPVECRICHSLLASAPLLTKAFTNMLPLKAFQEAKVSSGSICFSCTREMVDEMAYQCRECKKAFCAECDYFVHDSLQICPSC